MNYHHVVCTCNEIVVYYNVYSESVQSCVCDIGVDSIDIVLRQF